MSSDPLLPTVQDCIDLGEHRFNEAGLFFGHGTDNSADEALWLVFHQLNLPWDIDAAVLSKPVSESDYQAIQQLFQRRIDERIPAAYITGSAWFAGHEFIVNSHVLVPRSPIAELIQSGFQPWLTATKPWVLDLCTGSGCIGIATALSLPESHVILSDISREAIAVAQANIQHYQLQSRVKAIASDCLDHIQGTFDLIVTNPPYVDANDLATMPLEYQAEPEIALASGDDGLDFTRRLLREAADYLNPQGLLIVEVGNSWVNLEAAFPSVSFVWLAFEYGGHGVFVMTRDELVAYRAAFA